MSDERASSPMEVDLKGRTALVTGGGTGIGRSVSLAFARCGASVVVNYSQSQTEAEHTAQTIQQNGGQAITVRADVKEEEQVAALVKTAVDTFGGLEIVVANAVKLESCETLRVNPIGIDLIGS